MFTVTLSDTSSTDTVISYSTSGTATSGSDYTALPGMVTILAGETTATITLPVTDDAVLEDTETVTVTLNSIVSGNTGVSVGGTTVATIDILDNDVVTWNLVGDAAVTEGAAATYSIQPQGVNFPERAIS